MATELTTLLLRNRELPCRITKAQSQSKKQVLLMLSQLHTAAKQNIFTNTKGSVKLDTDTKTKEKPVMTLKSGHT